MPFEVTLPGSNATFQVENEEELNKVLSSTNNQTQSAIASEPSYEERALRDLGYFINDSSNGKMNVEKGNHKYTIFGHEISPSIQDYIDKKVSTLHGIGAGSGVNFLLNQIQKNTGPLAQEVQQRFFPGATNEAPNQIQSFIDNAVQAKPAENIAGSLLGSVVGAPAMAVESIAPLIEQLPKAYKAANVIPAALKGFVGGSTNEVVTNPDATPGSITRSGLIGGGLNGGIAGITAGADRFSKFLINYATKTDRPEIAEYVTKYLGPSLTKGELAAKNEEILTSTEKQLQSHLADLDKQGKVVDMAKVVKDPKLLEDALSLENVGDRNKATAIIKRLSDLENRGNISLVEANDLKRDLYKVSNFDKQNAKPALAEFQRKASLAIKDAIEEASGSPVVKELNTKLANGIKLKEGLASKGGLARQIKEGSRAAAEVASIFHSGGAALPGIAAERLATSVPGSTTLASGTNALRTGAKSSFVQNLLSALGNR